MTDENSQQLVETKKDYHIVESAIQAKFIQ